MFAQGEVLTPEQVQSIPMSEWYGAGLVETSSGVFGLEPVLSVSQMMDIKSRMLAAASEGEGEVRVHAVGDGRAVIVANGAGLHQVKVHALLSDTPDAHARGVILRFNYWFSSKIMPSLNVSLAGNSREHKPILVAEHEYFNGTRGLFYYVDDESRRRDAVLELEQVLTLHTDRVSVRQETEYDGTPILHIRARIYKDY